MPSGSGEPMTASILLVEDDLLAQAMYVQHLQAAGYDVTAVGTVEAMRGEAARRPFDLFLVDLGLPDGNGLKAAEVIGDSATAVMCITANRSTDVRISALERVAADFLVKPFDERELVVRVRNLLRRRLPGTGGSFTFQGFTYHARTGRLLDPEGKTITLSTTDQKLLYALTMNSGRPLNREWLSTRVLGRCSEADQRVIDVQVSRLRRKFGGKGAKVIRTVRHVGYRLDAEFTLQPADG